MTPRLTPRNDIKGATPRFVRGDRKMARGDKKRGSGAQKGGRCERIEGSKRQKWLIMHH